MRQIELHPAIIAGYLILSIFVYKHKAMSLSKTSGNQAELKQTRAARPRSGNVVAKTAAFNNTNMIVLTVNPKLDEIASAENLNAKAESAKQMFANYRNKK